MRTLSRTALFIFISACLSTTALCQFRNSVNINNRNVQRTVPPYTAEFKITRTRIHSDGSTVTNITTEKRALDSHRRTFFSSTTMPTSGDSQPITITRVSDPEEGTRTTWDTNSNVAKVEKTIEAETGSSSCSTTSTAHATTTIRSRTGARRGRSLVDDLGTSTMQGVDVHGIRTTETIPPATLNDNPKVIVRETWTAPSLNNMVLGETVEDPEEGKTSIELVNISVGDPDASLFQPPADYKVETREVFPCEQGNSTP